MLQIFLESKEVEGSGAGHMYLVLRDVESSDPIDNVAQPTDSVIRGGMDSLEGFNLDTYIGFLSSSEDAYDTGVDPVSRCSLNITTAVVSGSGASSVLAAWNAMADLVGNLDGNYDYELPGIVGPETHTSNSNATILTALNSVNVDVRTLTIEDPVTHSQVNYFTYTGHSNGFPGGEDGASATLLGASNPLNALAERMIVASDALETGLALLGRDATDDILVGTTHSDRFYGGDDYDSNEDDNFDTVDFSKSDTTVNISSYFQQSISAPVNVGSGGAADGDTFFGIENFIGSSNDDQFVVDSDATSDLASHGGDARILVGGAGSDTFLTNSGSSSSAGYSMNNVFDGSSAYKKYIYEGTVGQITNATSEVDIVDYGGNGFAAASSAINISIGNLGSGQISPMEARVSVAGVSGYDTLISIEKIAATTHADTVTFYGAQSDIQASGLQSVDGRDGHDTIDLSNMTSGMMFGFVDGPALPAGITLTNFEDVIGTNYNDTVRFTGSFASLLSMDEATIALGANTSGTFDGLDFQYMEDAITLHFDDDSIGDIEFSGVEYVIGTYYNDEIYGDENANIIENGFASSFSPSTLTGDHIKGGGGADILIAGPGAIFDAESHTDRANAAIVFRANLLVTGGGVDEADVNTSGIKITGGAPVELGENEYGDPGYAGDGYNVRYIEHLASYENETTLHTNLTVEIFIGAGIGEYSASTAVIQFVIEDFHDGDFGIHIDGTNSAASAITIPHGDPFDFDIDGTSGDDDLKGTSGNDTMYGGDGNDIVDGGYGNDTLVGGSGHGDDSYDGGSGFDTLIYSSAVDSIAVDLGAGTASGNDIDSDIIMNIEAVVGGAGDDSITGDEGDNVFTGGAGDDTLVGAGGSDTYKFSIGDGHDTIDDYGSPADMDVLVIDADSTTIQVERDPSSVWDMNLVIGSGGDEVTVKNHFGDNYQFIEEVQFADGVTWDEQMLRQVYLAQHETSGNDTIYGFWVDDLLDGGAGDDTIDGIGGDDTIIGGTGDDSVSGGQGSNTYIYNLGDGHDTLQEWGDVDLFTDTVSFGADIDVSDISVQRSSSDFFSLELVNSQDGGSIEIVGQFANSMMQVEQFVFADSTVWTAADIREQLIATQSTSGDDVIDGFYNDDVIDGGAGGDAIYADDGNDIITGGTGDDVLFGGNGDDTFIFATGDGYDWIEDFTAGAATEDVIDLSGVAGITSFADVMNSAYETPDGTILDFGNDEGIGLANVAMSSLHADDFRFAA